MNHLATFAKIITVLSIFASINSFARDRGDRRRPYQPALCAAAAAQMASNPELAPQICESYIGCRYIEPRVLSGACVARDPATRHQIQPFCDIAVSAAAAFPDQAERACQSIGQCTYVQPEMSSYFGECVPAR